VTVRSFLRRAGVFVLVMSGAGFAAPALASDAGTVGAGGPENFAFAGYRYSPSSQYYDATTTFVVPKLKCGSANRAIAAAIGLKGSTESDYGGPYRIEAGLFIGCHAGKARYWPELKWEVAKTKNYPTDVARAGDTIVLRLYSTTEAPGPAVSVVDKTHRFHVSKTHIECGACSPNVGWAGDSGWRTSGGRLEGVPDFGTLTYTNTRVHGHPLGQTSPTRHDRRTNARLQIKAGSLFNSGTAFRTFFKHS
jgi:hypothetical protein